jgi:hypothetical protein
VYNSVVTGNSGGSVTGNPVNSRVNGAGVNPGTAAAYWPVANGVLNTAGPYVNGGDLRVVYTRLNGLDSAMKPEIISLLEYLLPTGMGAKE